MSSKYTSSEFNSMLKTYMPYELLTEDLKRRNYFWNKVKKDENWRGGNAYSSAAEGNGGSLIVPFEGAEASSMSFGNLTATGDVSQAKYVRGVVDSYRELWGTMKFYEKDLDGHVDLQKSFLKVLPGKIEQFNQRMSETVSHSLLNGNYICLLTADASTAGTGMVTVDHPERLSINQLVHLAPEDSSLHGHAYFVTAINMNTKVVTLSATQGGGAATLGTYTHDDSTVGLYVPGIYTDGAVAQTSPVTYFTSLPSALLSAGNGGSSTLYGQTKTTYPYLQAQNISGASITADNILEKLFDAFIQVVTLGKGMPTTMLMSMKNFANAGKSLEDNRQYSVTDKSAGYGWRKLNVLGNEGEMELVGVRDMDDSKILILDWDAFKFHGADFFNRKRHLNGEEFFLERAVTGYTYLVDVRFYGDLIVNRPSNCGVIYSVSY